MTEKKTSVILKTGGHCIETSAKKEFMRITGLILDSTDDTVQPEMEYGLELLKDFLETADFNTLRSSDDRLSGVVEGTCLLSRDENGIPVLELMD
jgi:hypothetical protein